MKDMFTRRGSLLVRYRSLGGGWDAMMESEGRREEEKRAETNE